MKVREWISRAADSADCSVTFCGGGETGGALPFNSVSAVRERRQKVYVCVCVCVRGRDRQTDRQTDRQG